MDRDDVAEVIKAPDAPKPAEVSKPAAEDKSVTRGGVVLSRPELVHGTTTGEPVEYDKFPKDREKPPKELEVTINPETVQKYEMELRTYVADMSELAKRPAPAGSSSKNMLDHVLADPKRRSDKLIMDQISKNVVGADGETITREVNADALSQFLAAGKEANWAAATALLEQQALFGEMASGMDAAINSPLYNTLLARSTRNDSSAILNKAPTLRRIGKTVASHAYIGAIAAGYFTVGRGTTELNFKSDIELIALLKLNTSTEDLAYIEARTGIDLNRINVGQNAKGELSFSFVEGYKPPLRDNKARIVNARSARSEFLKQLNIDEPDSKHLGIEADRSIGIGFPEQFIYDDKKHRFTRKTEPEGLSVRYSMDIMKKYSEIVSLGASKYERLTAMADAREAVMVEYLERQIKLEKVAKDQESITALGKKKEAMERKDPSLITEQREKLTETKRAATEAKATAETRKTELVDVLPDKLRAVQRLEEQILQDFDLPNTENFVATVENRITELRGKVDEANKALQTARQNKSRAIAGHANGLHTTFKEHTAAIRELANKVNNGSKIGSGGGAGGAAVESGGDTTINLPQPPNFDELLKKLTEAENIEHDGHIQNAKEEYEELKAELASLKTKQNEYRTVVREREDATFAIVHKDPGQLEEGSNAFDMFTDPASIYIAPTYAAVTEAQIGELSIDDLAAVLEPAINDPKERVKLAILAKSSLKASQEKIPDYQTDAMIDVTKPSTGIKLDDLFRAVNELRDDLRTADPKITPENARTMILNARMAAERLVHAQTKARTELEIEYYGQVIKDTDKKIEKLGDFKEQKEELDATIKVLNGWEDIFSRGYQIVDDPDKLAGLTDAAIVSSSDTGYSTAEREAAEEKGYYEWVRFLRPDYISHETDRDKIFEAMHRILPPDKLAELLNTHLSLGTRSPRTLDRVLGRLSSRNLSGADMQLVSKQIMNYMRDRGLEL